MKIIIIGILFLFACIIALYIILKPYFIDKNIRNNIDNFDTFMMNYVFIVNDSKHNIIKKLSIHNIYDKPNYTYDVENQIICFNYLTADIKYKLEFISADSTHIYLLVSQIYILHSKSNIPYMINTFFTNKINAQPFDYSTFERLVNNNK